MLAILVTGAFRLAHGQEETPELITDRPDQTESSCVVPAGSLQIETGFVMENNSDEQYQSRGYLFNTTLLRYGLLDNFEFRAGLAYAGRQVHTAGMDSVSSVSGFSPLYTGFKVQITREQGFLPEIALIGGLILPFTAGEAFKTDHTAGNMRLSVSHSLSNRLSWGCNLGVSWDGESVMPTYSYTVVLGIELTGKLGIFVEGFGFIPESEQGSHLLDGGITYLVLPNLQLDMSAGLGLNERAIDNFLSIGFSWRINNLM